MVSTPTFLPGSIEACTTNPNDEVTDFMTSRSAFAGKPLMISSDSVLWAFNIRNVFNLSRKVLQRWKARFRALSMVFSVFDSFERTNERTSRTSTHFSPNESNFENTSSIFKGTRVLFYSELIKTYHIIFKFSLS